MEYTPDTQKKRSAIHRIQKKIFLGYALAKRLVLAAKAARRLRGVPFYPYPPSNCCLLFARTMQTMHLGQSPTLRKVGI